MRAMPEHAHDLAAQLSEAEARCAAAGESMTPIRRRVLQLLLETNGPAKAYDLLERMQNETGGRAKPPTIYRALDFLTRLGIAHRLETLNAYVACERGACARATIFLLCESCGRSDEFDAGHASVDLEEAARGRGFRINRTMIEVRGECAKCASQ
jgi:Fur family zinc uptake transcriptional regulator